MKYLLNFQKWIYSVFGPYSLFVATLVSTNEKASLILVTYYYLIKNNKANNEELFGQVSLKYQLLLFSSKYLSYLWLKFYFITFVTKCEVQVSHYRAWFSWETVCSIYKKNVPSTYYICGHQSIFSADIYWQFGKLTTSTIGLLKLV